MNLRIKTIDKNKNKCKLCGKESYLGGIIARKTLLCDTCYSIISNIEVDDIEYDFYKDKIKRIILRRYELVK